MAFVFPAFGALALFLSVMAGAVSAKTMTVGPSGTYRALDQVPWADLSPGDEVLLESGAMQTRPTVIAARGTVAKPIRIAAAPGARPEMHNSFVFDGAQHVIVEGFNVVGSRDSGVIIRRGSESITVRHMTLRRNGLGLWIGDGAGGSHRITDNEMSENQTHGVAVYKVINPPGRETIFGRNRVFKNGHHGFEITGTRFVIEDNTVYENGQTQFGISGIHLYAGGFRGEPRMIGMGSHNIVRYNTVFRNLDHRAPDGNGIQADTWCDDNEISYNVVFENDGAGIIVYDGARNRIVNNTAFGNQRDPGKTHRYRGELVVATADSQKIENSIGTVVKNNLLVATSKNAVAILVDKFSAGSTEIGGNLLFNAGGGAIYSWAGEQGRDITRWLAQAKPQPADIAADPLFVDTGNLPDGLKLRANSPAIGRGQNLGLTRDRAGSAVPKDRAPAVGAYEVAP